MKTFEEWWAEEMPANAAEQLAAIEGFDRHTMAKSFVGVMLILGKNAYDSGVEEGKKKELYTGNPGADTRLKLRRGFDEGYRRGLIAGRAERDTAAELENAQENGR